MSMGLTRQTGKELALEAAFFIAAAGEIALCHRHALLLTALLIATAALTLGGFGFKRHLIALYVICGVLGPTAEILGVSAGAWHYAAPDFLGIPLWLPFAWGVVSVLSGGIAATVAELMRP